MLRFSVGIYFLCTDCISISRMEYVSLMLSGSYMVFLRVLLYSRTTKTTYKFGFPENWLLLHPTCHHNYENLEELIKNFVETPNRWGNAEMFYLWGHSYEFDNNDNWDVIDKFAEYA